MHPRLEMHAWLIKTAKVQLVITQWSQHDCQSYASVVTMLTWDCKE